MLILRWFKIVNIRCVSLSNNKSNADAEKDDFSEFLTKFLRIGILTRFLNKFIKILNCFWGNLTNFSGKFFKRPYKKTVLKKPYQTKEFILSSMIQNRTIPGIALIETILSVDSLYYAYSLLYCKILLN